MSHFIQKDKLISLLKKYYGRNEVTTAINILLKFYEDEAFDDEDIINDWIQDDFDNCHGIHKFVTGLNYRTEVDNPTNKQILFQWFCHWLSKNVPEPKDQPAYPIVQTTSSEEYLFDLSSIAKVQYDFAEKLKQ
eukprot:523364_1